MIKTIGNSKFFNRFYRSNCLPYDLSLQILSTARFAVFEGLKIVNLNDIANPSSFQVRTVLYSQILPVDSILYMEYTVEK